jgi:hypothetical protein
MARRERGEYRPIYVALVDGADFTKLSKWARALFYPLKLSLGSLGIAAFPGAMAALAERSGLRLDEVDAAVAELEASGWLRREGNVWWLVRGLEFEPTLNANDRKHVAYVQREWQTLPNLPIRNAFRDHYAQFFPASAGPSKGLDGASEGASMALGSTSPSPSPTPSPLPSPAPAKALPGDGDDGDDVLRALEDPDHRDAYLGYRRAARDPQAVQAVIRAVQRGVPGHGPGYPWRVVGQALLELRAKGSEFSEGGLRGFARMVRDRRPERPRIDLVTDDLGRDVPAVRTAEGGWRYLTDDEARALGWTGAA